MHTLTFKINGVPKLYSITRPRVLVVGGNGQGKSTLVSACSVAIYGEAQDYLWRSRVRSRAHLQRGGLTDVQMFPALKPSGPSVADVMEAMSSTEKLLMLLPDPGQARRLYMEAVGLARSASLTLRGLEADKAVLFRYGCVAALSEVSQRVTAAQMAEKQAEATLARYTAAAMDDAKAILARVCADINAKWLCPPITLTDNGELLVGGSASPSDTMRARAAAALAYGIDAHTPLLLGDLGWEKDNLRDFMRAWAEHAYPSLLVVQTPKAPKGRPPSGWCVIQVQHSGD